MIGRVIPGNYGERSNVLCLTGLTILCTAQVLPPHGEFLDYKIPLLSPSFSLSLPVL